MSTNDNSENMKSDRKKRVVKKVIIKRAATQKLPPKLAEQLAKDNKAGLKITLQDIREEIAEDEKRKKVQRRVPGKIRTKKSTTKKLSKETAEEVVKRKKSLAKATTKKLSPEAAQKVFARVTEPEKTEGSEKIGIITRTPSVKTIPPSKEEIPFKEESRLPENWKENKIAWYKKLKQSKRAMPPLPKNALLKNKRKNTIYKITDIIQQDCFGGIYKAFQEQDKQNPVKTIKEIQFKSPPDSSPNLIKDVMNRLSRMASFLEDANHENLSNIKDYIPYFHDEHSGCFFVIMEFIEGKTLENIIHRYLKEGKPLPGDLILHVARSLCNVLQYLHNRKPFPISFGDIKPSNIMLKDDNTIKLINYGLDKAFEIDSEEKESYRGTVGYSAPEQSGVDFTNTKADIFAFGACLYYLITGINPEEKPYEFRTFRDLKPGISKRVEHLIFQCLDLNPDNRPSINKLKTQIEETTINELDTEKEPRITHKLSLTGIEEQEERTGREERKKDTIQLQEEKVKSVIKEPEKTTKSVIKLPDEIKAEKTRVIEEQKKLEEIKEEVITEEEIRKEPVKEEEVVVTEEEVTEEEVTEEVIEEPVGEEVVKAEEPVKEEEEITEEPVG